jgi:hypothetical protein
MLSKSKIKKTVKHDDHEPQVGDVVQITGKEWFGHPMMLSIGIAVKDREHSGEPVERTCYVQFESAGMWIYVSDLTIVSRASTQT